MDSFEALAVTVMLVVEDVEASRDWYVRVLDAELHGEYGGTSVVLRIQGTWVLLVTGGGPDEGKPTVRLAPPAEPDLVSAQLVFRVEDCRATHALLTSRGAEFLAPPHDRGSEVRAFLRDPDGHLLEVSSLRGASDAAEAASSE